MLISFEVRKLIVTTAIDSLVETWTVCFGFVPMQKDEKRSLNKTNLMVFLGIEVLRKSLCGNETADSEKINASESRLRIDEAPKEAALARESNLEVEMAENILMEAAAEAESNLGSLASVGNDEKQLKGTVWDGLPEFSNMRVGVGKESDEAVLLCGAGQTTESDGRIALEISGDGSHIEIICWNST
ncbi:hypothetical protein Nepgr_026768 [Nepenthes gracilis]|uniref:Increased DNA methylation 1 C-terminal domain-containing protein n=1 Tax=Nepenthes gracilis TaxID=150966 RepID=A0AAD3T8I7_NEPGR|nr:hypothetical protein Nepgr_026768 [Nepenthes gracilis]